MATNRADTLDPALLRPGRLDRKIEFPLPDRRQKRLVFQVRPPSRDPSFASRAIMPAAASRCRFLIVCGVAAHCIACAIGWCRDFAQLGDAQNSVDRRMHSCLVMRVHFLG